MVADVRAYRRYQADHSRLPCPVTALGWTDDHEVPPALLSGWDQYADTDTRLLKGSHWSFLSFPDELREVLAGEHSRAADAAASAGTSDDQS
ncbi:hypothetical protein [Streptomyces sp. NPDC088923]|uniref:hypothetical protein n=1 Tax=Streptomyces sp. NPDC088923 TaxID=3365913 RepID=UPI0038136A7C